MRTWVSGRKPLPCTTNTVCPSPNGWLSTSLGFRLVPLGSELGGLPGTTKGTSTDVVAPGVAVGPAAAGWPRPAW